jgi:chemotaxis protein CheD
MNFDWNTLTITPISQGEYDVSADPTIVYSTVLGSCISVCMTDIDLQIGGLNHFLLPGIGEKANAGERFGVNAMEMLINGLFRLGATRTSLNAKIFGGSSMSKAHVSIGKSNGAFAQEFLSKEGIACSSSSIGGNFARRIHFHPTSGRVRQLKIEQQEQEPTLFQPLRTPIRREPDITLFDS